ncbi:COX assembly mitochondrial protein homolog isoform X2 [Rattus norvegicus]|uniref:COX assembly mitochondrial protein homolog isoform X2 n=1 Tax=Rattus norvegicus TaxID=10116 RepID=UPI0003D0BF7C|nr:COX assembly mitochondrial protein homolog isoform X2 [Rattus norvegicus]
MSGPWLVLGIVHQPRRCRASLLWGSCLPPSSAGINSLYEYWGSESSAAHPSEQHLRHVEKDVLIPKIMREKARERCSEQVEDFTRCCKDSGILMVLKCRKENSALKDCLTAYYNDPAFYEECKLEYLKEREEFRRTGVPTKKRLQKLPTSM